MLTREIVGHILGAVAVALTFLSYQMREKKPILLVQSGATLLTCMQYLLIGGYSGFALNAVCLIRNFFFYHRDKKFFSGIYIPIIFACMMPIVSIFSWEGWYSLFIIAGLMINTVCLGVCSPQGLRKSILLTSMLIIVYNLIVASYTGLILECIAISSAVIGLIRFSGSRAKNKAE